LIKANQTLIGTDLVLEEPNRREPPPLSAAELAPELEVSFVTHGHGDHFHRRTSRVLSAEGKCTFVIPKSCAGIARELQIDEARIRVASPKEAFELKRVRVEPIRAIHGNRKFAVYDQANLEDCGYVITIGGKTFLQPGDSVLLEDQLFLKHVDVLFFSPTEHNTHIDRSVILINELQPDYILPQHRDTYVETPDNRFWTHGYAREVQLLLAKPLQQK
jgi:L-ascorbate metabolism protein UlaG (beta-lactamase superfamily)